MRVEQERRFATRLSIGYSLEFYGAPLIAYWILYVARSHNSNVSRVLCTQPLQAAGNVSYVLYCIHWPATLFYGWIVMGAVVDFPRMPAFHILLLYPIFFCLSAVLHRFVEKPAREFLLRRLTRAAADKLEKAHHDLVSGQQTTVTITP